MSFKREEFLGGQTGNGFGVVGYANGTRIEVGLGAIEENRRDALEVGIPRFVGNASAFDKAPVRFPKVKDLADVRIRCLGVSPISTDGGIHVLDSLHLPICFFGQIVKRLVGDLDAGVK